LHATTLKQVMMEFDRNETIKNSKNLAIKSHQFI
jgi:hypothetical protein